MKNILYVTTVSSTINAFLVPHIKDLIKKGNIVDCAASLNRSLDKSLIDLGVNFFDIPFSRNPLDPRNLIAFKSLMNLQKLKNYDIVHVHTPVAAFYGRLLKLKFKNLRTIYTAHGFHFYHGAPKVNWIIYYPIEKIMSNFTDTIITMNEEDYKYALKFNIKNTYKISGVGLDLSKYNPKLFDKSNTRKELSLNESDFVILMIAELNKNKNHIQMIETIDILRKKGIEVKVLCAGKGPLKDNIIQEIKSRNLEPYIDILGFRNDIPKLISACDIGMLLSYREGLPRNIMEFMAYGKPVIGTNIRGIKDLISKNYLVNIGDSERLAEKIEAIYSNRLEIQKVEEHCEKEICKYNIDNVLKELDYIYKHI